MKKLLFALVLLGSLAIFFSSCASGPRYGCTRSRYITGHKPGPYGY